MTDGPPNLGAATLPAWAAAPTEVIVAGGGPAGLAAAIELGRLGISCVVVEPRVDIDPTRPRAKTTSTRTMEHLRRWGIADRLRMTAPLPVSWSQDVIFADSLLGTEITRFRGAFGLLDQKRGLSAETGQQAPQPVVEAVLRASAAALDSVRVLTGYRVTHVEQDADTVRATVEPVSLAAEAAGTVGGPSEFTITGQYLIGADGSGGGTRRAIGASYQGSSNDIPNLSILFRAPSLADQVELDPAVQYWIINPEASGLMGRLDLDDTWWAIVQSVPEDLDTVDPVTMVRSLLGGSSIDVTDLEIEVIATDPWNARMLLVDRYRDGRIFLAGDAAHLNPPWGGHGFNTCLGDAVNIGWKLAAVLRGWADPALLDSYQAERRPVAAQTIVDAGAQEKLLAPSFVRRARAEGAAPADARRMLAESLQDKQSEFQSPGLVLGYHYAGSPVVVDDGSPIPAHDPTNYHDSARPGARLPHRWLPDGRSVHDEVGTGMTLLHGPDVSVEQFVTAAAALRIPLRTFGIPAAVAESYGAALLLIRPDQHVAWRGADDRQATLVLEIATGRESGVSHEYEKNHLASASRSESR